MTTHAYALCCLVKGIIDIDREKGGERERERGREREREQGLLLLVLRHYIARQYIKDVF